LAERVGVEGLDRLFQPALDGDCVRHGALPQPGFPALRLAAESDVGVAFQKTRQPGVEMAAVNVGRAENVGADAEYLVGAESLKNDALAVR
jgi:hypothetical protein